MLCIALLSVYNLKSAQMNMQHSVIQELMFYEFKLGSNDTEVTKNIFCDKVEDAVDQSRDEPDGSRNFARIARPLTIRQS